jgi:small subunit ribosomal protein S4e
MTRRLKRLAAPRSWSIPRKTHVWAVKPSPGPHATDRSVPLLVILRDMLRLCDNAREARQILAARNVLVDGRVVTNPKFPVGLMDVLTIARTKDHYRMLVGARGRMTLMPVKAAEAKWKLVRIEDKTTVPGGRTQLNLHDGRNILLPKDGYRTGETLKIRLPSQKIAAEYPLEKGHVALLIGGQHAGEIGHIARIDRTRNPRANTVTFAEGFSTILSYVFVVGGETPEIAVPEVKAL